MARDTLAKTLAAFVENHWDLEETARALGISRRLLRERIIRYNREIDEARGKLSLPALLTPYCQEKNLDFSRW